MLMGKLDTHMKNENRPTSVIFSYGPYDQMDQRPHPVT